MEKKLTKEEKFNKEIDALKIIAVNVTPDNKTYVMFQRMTAKTIKNVWAVYSGKPEATTEEATKNFMKAKGQIKY